MHLFHFRSLSSVLERVCIITSSLNRIVVRVTLNRIKDGVYCDLTHFSMYLEIRSGIKNVVKKGFDRSKFDVFLPAIDQ